MSIPVTELEQREGELDEAREVITYCAGPACRAARDAAIMLAADGFRAKAYEGGIEEWKAAGLPTE